MIEPLWVTLAEALLVHRRVLQAAGGASGIRVPELLQSALARPRQRAAYEDVDLVALAATYTDGILRNHPFVDGNKRTAFVVGVLFLAKNGLVLDADEEEAALMVVRLAERAIDVDVYGQFLGSRIRKA